MFFNTKGKELNIENVLLSSLFLRIGLAFVFIFAAVSGFLHPENYAKYVPLGVSSAIPVYLFLQIFSGFEFILAIWLLSGFFTYYSGLLSAMLIFFITLLNFQSFDILFRNVAIFFASLALSNLGHKHS